MNKSQVIGIINDPEVTLGHLEKRNIILLNAWEVNWSDLTPEYSYILLGGHMGAYDTSDYPYLEEEKKWISKAVNDNFKVLGICLGAQLIADALDGKAYLSENIEVFTWHRDTFKLPSNAKLIAKTSFPQIYSIKKTFGIQFHPEINENLFEKWYVGEKTKKELENFDIDKEFKRIKTNESEISISVNSLFDKWIAS